MVMSATFAAATFVVTMVMMPAATILVTMVMMPAATFFMVVMMAAAFPVMSAATILMFMMPTALMRMRCISHYPFLLFI